MRIENIRRRQQRLHLRGRAALQQARQVAAHQLRQVIRLQKVGQRHQVQHLGNLGHRPTKRLQEEALLFGEVGKGR